MLDINTNNRKFYSFLMRIKHISQNNGLFLSKRSNISARTIIEDGSRINGKITIKGESKCHIKKYCALGSDIKVITSNHDMLYLNLQIALQRKIGAAVSHSKMEGVVIGHNVWIGDNVIILPNVTIGNGAIIGAGAVITKDVPSYAVCVGNPAKVIKYRFDQSTIDEIENLDWWNWPLEKMKKNVEIFNKTWK